MELTEIRLLLDGAMVVIIWMVQRIVYPIFLYCEKKHLISWHKIYSGRLAVIVMPLMLGQLIISIIQLLSAINLNSTTYALFVWLLWGITCTVFVPLHSKIANGNSTLETLKKLIKRNWIRTILWSVLLIITLLQKLFL
jgi:hypothetical protein